MDEITSVQCLAQSLPVVLEGLKEQEPIRAAKVIRAIEFYLEDHDVKNSDRVVEIGEFLRTSKAQNVP